MNVILLLWLLLCFYVRMTNIIKSHRQKLHSNQRRRVNIIRPRNWLNICRIDTNNIHTLHWRELHITKKWIEGALIYSPEEEFFFAFLSTKKKLRLRFIRLHIFILIIFEIFFSSPYFYFMQLSISISCSLRRVAIHIVVNIKLGQQWIKKIIIEMKK